MKKIKNLLANFHDKNEYETNLKQALNHGLVFPKLCRAKSKSLAKTIHWYKYGAAKKAENYFEKWHW